MIGVFCVLVIGSCSQSQQEPSTQQLDSVAKQPAEQRKETVAGTTTAAESATAAADSSATDSLTKAAESVKKAAQEKTEEVAEVIKKSHPDAYDPTPVDKEPETDMASLRKAIVYPKEAKDRGIEGSVRVRALIAANGKVVKAFVESSSNKIFDEPAQTAVKQAKFTPAVRKGKRVERWISVPVIFRLL